LLGGSNKYRDFETKLQNQIEHLLESRENFTSQTGTASISLSLSLYIFNFFLLNYFHNGFNLLFQNKIKIK